MKLTDLITMLLWYVPQPEHCYYQACSHGNSREVFPVFWLPNSDRSSLAWVHTSHRLSRVPLGTPSVPHPALSMWDLAKNFAVDKTQTLYWLAQNTGQPKQNIHNKSRPKNPNCTVVVSTSLPSRLCQLRLFLVRLPSAPLSSSSE